MGQTAVFGKGKAAPQHCSMPVVHWLVPDMCCLLEELLLLLLKSVAAAAHFLLSNRPFMWQLFILASRNIP